MNAQLIVAESLAILGAGDAQARARVLRGRCRRRTSIWFGAQSPPVTSDFDALKALNQPDVELDWVPAAG